MVKECLKEVCRWSLPHFRQAVRELEQAGTPLNEEDIDFMLQHSAPGSTQNELIRMKKELEENGTRS